jgi:polar amino acid transport system substrate-binding protein
MRKFRFRAFFVMVATLAIVAAACSSDESRVPADTAPATTGATGATGTATACEAADTSAGDLLAEICSAGVVKVSTDPAYPPQSSLNPDTGEYEGFDIDVATAIAERLGVEIEWQTPSWTAVTAGNWQGRWDMSVGSMTVTTERAEVLDFTPAYYFTPAAVAVPAGSDVTTVEGLSGKTIAVCSACTYDFFLQGTLEIPGYTFNSPITDPVIKGFDTDSTAIQAALAGQADAVSSALPTLQAAIDKGRELTIVGDPLFYEPLSVAIDKSSELDQASFVAAVSAIIEEMHADGTLTSLSMAVYGEDLTTSAA